MSEATDTSQVELLDERAETPRDKVAGGSHTPFRLEYARAVMRQMAVVGAVALLIVAWNVEFLRGVYVERQMTTAGWAINGAIVTLFLLGVARVVALLRRYQREEQALARFLGNLEGGAPDPAGGLALGAMIVSRFDAMRALHAAATPINHSALASTLVSAESTRTSFPRFINNVLILTGVFGTIVALSIALIGASNLLESEVSAGGMGMVIHGMSTALSTTMTAILCFLYFGYFYLKLGDVQTNLLSGIEHVTAVHLMPRFHVEADTVLHELADLVRTLRDTVQQLSRERAGIALAEQQLYARLDEDRVRGEALNEGIDRIAGLLREGFRLPEDRS